MALALAVTLVAPSAFADSKQNAAKAAELFKSSAEAYRQGNFKGTVDLLKQAYALDPQPVMLYNLGRAYEGIGDIDAAMDAYKKYLAADPKAPDRPSIEQRIATLQRTKDDRATLEKQRDDERKKAEENARLAAEEQKRADEERKRADEEHKKKAHHRSIGPYIVGGIGAAGLVAGGAFGLMANSKHDSAATERVQATAMDQQDQAKTFATISTVSLIAGGVVLAAGVTWWVLDAPPKDQADRKAVAPTTRIGVAPAYITLERSF